VEGKTEVEEGESDKEEANDEEDERGGDVSANVASTHDSSV
jgi:hypothetical protein